MSWQPIETAPKDGTIIIISSRGLIYAAYWSQCYRAMSAGVGDEKFPWVFLDETNGVNSLIENSPTHWMPLPSPPNSEDAG